MSQKIDEKISMDKIKSSPQTEEITRCSNCGVKNTEEANYCKSWGEQLDSRTEDLGREDRD